MNRMWMGLVGFGVACGVEVPVGGPRGDGGTATWGSTPTTTGNLNLVHQAAPWVDFDMSVLPGALCGITDQGTIDCPLAAARGIAIPEGEFVSVAITGGAEAAGCALGGAGELVCFDGQAGSRLVSDTPEGRFVAVAGHSFIYAHACAVSEERKVVCWGEGIEEDPPDEGFGPALSGWHDTWCGLLEDGGISCWATTGAGSSEVIDQVPEGAWDAVSVGEDYACAMRGTAVTCWGDLPGDDPPDEALSSVGTGEWNTCGVLLDGSGVCWGTNGWGQRAVPEGAFAKVLPGREQVCGLRPNGEVTCWGLHIP